MNDEWSWKIYECENLKQKPAVQWGSQVPTTILYFRSDDDGAFIFSFLLGWSIEE